MARQPFKLACTKRNPRTGEVKRYRSRSWYYQVKDEFGVWSKPIKGTSDKKSTAELQRQAELAVIQRRLGYAPIERAAAQLLSEQLAAYIAFLESKGDTPRHVRHTRRWIEMLLEGIAARTIDDVKKAKVENWLAARRASGAFGPETSNHYAGAVKSFTRWLADEERIPADPLAGLRRVNAEAGRVRVRRALSAADFSRLIAAVRKGKAHKGLSPSDRAMLYQLAAYTGLRRSELLALTPTAFSLATTPPTVTVEARHTKNRRTAVLTLPDWLARELKPWLKGRGEGRLWARGKWYRTADLLKHDLAAANIPYVDAKGRSYDFHALRSQFITGLARAGVELSTAQKMARHSDPKLTARHYTHLELEDHAAAVEKLPRPKRGST